MPVDDEECTGTEGDGCLNGLNLSLSGGGGGGGGTPDENEVEDGEKPPDVEEVAVKVVV